MSLTFVQTKNGLARVQDVKIGDFVFSKGKYVEVKKPPMFGLCDDYVTDTFLHVTVKKGTNVCGPYHVIYNSKIETYSSNYNRSYFYRGFLKARSKEKEHLFFPMSFKGTLTKSYVATFDEFPYYTSLYTFNQNHGPQIMYRSFPKGVKFQPCDFSKQSLLDYFNGYAINGFITRGRYIRIVGVYDEEVSLIFRLLNLHVTKKNNDLIFSPSCNELVLSFLSSKHTRWFSQDMMERLLRPAQIMDEQIYSRVSNVKRNVTVRDWYLPDIDADINTFMIGEKQWQN